MQRKRSVPLDELATLLDQWPERTLLLVQQGASDVQLEGVAKQASEVIGEAGFAFKIVSDSLSTEEQYAALRVVLQWGMCGLLLYALRALDPSEQTISRFLVHLQATGRVPFVMKNPDYDEQPDDPATQIELGKPET